MATEPRPLISEDLLHQLQVAAREQNREATDLLDDAVRQYLRDLKWRRLVDEGEQRAMAKGLTEADVPRLIEEVRAENRVRRQ